MLTVTQNRLDQTCQPCAGSDLHKGADAIVIHRLNLGHKLNRAGQLVGQQFLDGCTVSRVGGCSAVGIDRHGPIAKPDISQCCQKRRCCISNQCAVEGCRNRQLFTGELTACAGCLGQSDLIGCAGQHRLGRCIAVGNYQVDLFLSQHLLNRCQWCRDCQHAAFVTTACCHQTAPQAGQGME